MKDYLINVLSKGMGIRGIACITSNLSRFACTQHGTSTLGSIILSQALSAGALVGGLIKQKERIGLKYEGNGPIKKILVETDSYGAIRGYIGNPNAELEKGKSLNDAIGKAGLLTVIKDLGLKEPYQGTVHLVSGNIGKDLAYYFINSEQIPTAIGVNSDLDDNGQICCCGGFLVQSLPKKGGKGSNEANVEAVIERINQLSLKNYLAKNKTPEDIIDFIFSEVPYDILQVTDLTFKCICSKEKLKRALISLGEKDIKSLIQEGGAETICEYCRKKYNFDINELENLL